MSTVQDIIPLRENVLVRVLPPEQLGVIVLSDNTQPIFRRGIVVRTGEGRLLDNGNYARPLTLAGDTVVFAPNAAGLQLDKDHVLVPEYMLLAVVSAEVE